jgi:hypothetical protein
VEKKEKEEVKYICLGQSHAAAAVTTGFYQSPAFDFFGGCRPSCLLVWPALGCFIWSL